MQKTLPILGLFAVLMVGMITPAIAEYDNKWEQKYIELENEFEEKRHQIDRQFQQEFEELDKYYEQEKMQIYEKIENSDLSDSEIDKIFDELFREFEEKRHSLEADMMIQFKELDEMFQKELRHLDETIDNQRHDGTYDYEPYKDGTYVNYEPYKDDSEWKSIEPLAQRIMDTIPMEKIQSLWESGQIDRLIELIVSETDLSYDEAKRVVIFFEKYDDRDYEKEHYPEHNYSDYNYPEHDYPVPQPTSYPDEQVLRLEQKISELEEENQILKETIRDMEEKMAQMNALLLEQVRFIYEWVTTQ